MNAIKIGADVSLVVSKFMHWLLVDAEHGVIKFSKNKPILQVVADLYKRKIDGENVGINEWLAASKNAAASADASAAYASAAYASAKKKSRSIQADKLLQLLEAA